MPKLAKALAQKVDEAEELDFEPVPDGIYSAVLFSCEADTGPSGAVWRWVFEITDEDYEGKRIFETTSLNEKALFRLKRIFAAYGVPTTTDTKLLVGKPIRLWVAKKIAQAGKRQGEWVNELRQPLPFEEDPDGVDDSINDESGDGEDPWSDE